jgi:hypothetical protein
MPQQSSHGDYHADERRPTVSSAGTGAPRVSQTCRTHVDSMPVTLPSNVDALSENGNGLFLSVPWR